MTALLAYAFFIRGVEAIPEPVGRVFVNQEILQTFNFLYGSLENEYAGCLYGSQNGNGIHINKFSETKIKETTPTSLTFEECQRTGDYLGTIHSHPEPQNSRFKASCEMSTQDAYSFGTSKDRIECVQCAINSIRCYTEDVLQNGFEVVVS